MKRKQRVHLPQKSTGRCQQHGHNDGHGNIRSSSAVCTVILQSRTSWPQTQQAAAFSAKHMMAVRMQAHTGKRQAEHAAPFQSEACPCPPRPPSASAAPRVHPSCPLPTRTRSSGMTSPLRSRLATYGTLHSRRTLRRPYLATDFDPVPPVSAGLFATSDPQRMEPGSRKSVPPGNGIT